MRTPLRLRVVEVIADLGEDRAKRYRYGSGCIVNGSTVLTAAHVVSGAITVRVRTPEKTLHDAVLDPSFVSETPDLALLEIVGFSPGLPPLPLARIDRNSDKEVSVACHAMGCPWFAEIPSPATFREVVDAEGVMPTLSGMAGGLLSVLVRDAPRPLPPEDPPLTESPWTGMSGAPVIADGRLVGVVIEHALRAGQSTITAVPLTAIERDDAHPLWGSGVGDPRAWWSRLGATGVDGLTILPHGGRASHVVIGLPDFVPSRVRDRERVRTAVLDALTAPAPAMVELRGAAGLGKTAVAAEIARDLFPGSAAFLTAAGYRGVAAASVLDRLADLVAEPQQRRLLRERLHQQEADTLTKLDDVLVTLATDSVLLVIDSAEELVDAQGRIQDEGLAAVFTEIGRTSGHGVRILFVRTLPARAGSAARTPPIPLRGLLPIALDGGLPPREYELFVADLTVAHDGRPPILPVADLRRITNCHPRRTEILVGIPPGSVPADLLATAQTAGLVDVIMASLDEPQRRAVEILAVCQRPVGIATVAQLTAEPQDAVAALLGGLVARRIARQNGTRYHLPQDEARAVAGTLDAQWIDETTGRAAVHYESVARGNRRPVRLEDCEDWFNAIDLHIAANHTQHALALMAEVDEKHLREWGHSDALMPWLEILSGRMVEVRDQVLHAALCGRALAQQGKLDAGVAKVYEAGVLNTSIGDSEAQLVLLIQMAGYLFRAGRIKLAAEQYETVTQLASADHPRVAEAKVGIALCQAQTGDLPAALANLQEAQQSVAVRRTKDRDARLLEVRLRYNRALIELELGNDDDCLAEVEAGREAALDLDVVPLVARCDDLAARVQLFRDRPEEALPIAEEACAAAGRIGNPDVSRIAGITLAVTLLRLNQRRRAVVAAHSAARYRRSLYVAEALAAEGVCAFRAGDATDRARVAFTDALRFAGDLVVQERRNVRAREAAAIARAGLFLLDDDAAEWPVLFAYQDSIECNDSPGARHRRRELFEILTAEQPSGTLRQIRALLARP
jgi:tetratricopeptide (TPR) repeat protein